jgi:hypothetical protein
MLQRGAISILLLHWHNINAALCYANRTDPNQTRQLTVPPPRVSPIAASAATFRATGITAYLEAGGTLENAQAEAAHESSPLSREMNSPGVHSPEANIGVSDRGPVGSSFLSRMGAGMPEAKQARP